MAAIIISAFPCCGKSYCTEHLSDKYNILDSDSSKFSWIYRKRTPMEIDKYLHDNYKDTPILEDEYERIVEEEIKVRNPNFIEEYINHIVDNVESADFIFVSSHLEVRKALDKYGLTYYTIYPEKDMPSVKNEWLGRMYSRGSDWNFLKFQNEHWEEFTEAVDDEPHGKEVIRLKNGEYITEALLLFIRDFLDKLPLEIDRTSYDLWQQNYGDMIKIASGPKLNANFGKEELKSYKEF